MIEALETNDNYYIVQEYCEGGDLEVKKRNVDIISEKNCAHIISQILDVIYWLHNKKAIHRNLHPANIIFKSNNKDNFELLVQGFDYVSSFTNKTIKRNLSDLQYISPEVLKEELGDSKVDIWALGVLAYNIIDDLSPFVQETDEETRKTIINNPVTFDSDAWSKVSDHCKNFIKKCLSKDPNQRPTAEELLEDPFIKSGAQQ